MSNVFLNLGCFDKKFPPPFINIDIREDVNPDIVDNAFVLNRFDDNSVDLIYCSHMFEHLKPVDASKALDVWFKKSNATSSPVTNTSLSIHPSIHLGQLASSPSVYPPTHPLTL